MPTTRGKRPQYQMPVGNTCQIRRKSALLCPDSASLSRSGSWNVDMSCVLRISSRARSRACWNTLIPNLFGLPLLRGRYSSGEVAPNLFMRSKAAVMAWFSTLVADSP